MVQNMQLAASEMDSVLVQLLSTWAERGRDGSPRSQVCYPHMGSQSYKPCRQAVTCVMYHCEHAALVTHTDHPQG